MRRASSSAQRSRRNGKGVLPPNPKQWNNEHAALDVREELRLPLDVPLLHATAYALLPDVKVYGMGELPASLEHLEHLRGPAARRWSGISVRVASDLEIVVYNDAHRMNRIRTTLMEEFFHIWLDHPRSALRLHGPSDASRTFNAAVENEAYSCGAAALVPYAGLKAKVEAGLNTTQIARHFEVSPELVLFRAKVTRTYRALRSSRP